ncbi:MAG: hypothetical protein ACLU70_05880 [Lachnospira sp.]
MKKKKIVVSVLLVCLLCVNLVSMAVKAETTSTIHSVSSWYDFKDAVQYSQDGDIIVVHGEIDLGTDVKIGSSSKHLTIKRGSADSRIAFEYINEAVTNITFDGGGIASSYSWITSKYETTFTNCKFNDFGNSENYSSSGSVGGAVKIQSGSCVFNDCTFENSYALAGGAIEIQGDSQVEINNCNIKNCGAVTCGGAIDNSSYAATCTITGGTITGNKANDFGGGVSNAGNTTITGTKVYANSAVNGGADVATTISGVTTLTDTVEQLNELFSTDNLEVTGWVCDYDFDENIYIPNVDPTKENALLKLEYSEKQPEAPEPTDPVEPSEPSEPSTDPSTEPSTPTDTEKPDETEPGTEPSETPEPTQPGKEEPDGKTDQSKSDDAVNTGNSGNTTTDTTNTNTSTVSSGDTVNSTTTNTTTDNSKVNSTGDTSTTTATNTTNNYYQTATGDTSQPVIQDSTPQHENNTYIVYPNSNEMAASSAGMDETVKTSDPVQNLNIDAKGVDCKIEVVDGKYNISINADQQQTAVDDSIKDNSMDWLQIIQVVLLVVILICLVRKPKER